MTVQDPIIGLVLPIVIDLVNRYVSNSKMRYIISVAMCLVVAGLLHAEEIMAGDVAKLLTSATTIFATATSVYKLYWEDSKVRSTYMK